MSFYFHAFSFRPTSFYNFDTVRYELDEDIKKSRFAYTFGDINRFIELTEQYLRKAVELRDFLSTNQSSAVDNERHKREVEAYAFVFNFTEILNFARFVKSKYNYTHPLQTMVDVLERYGVYLWTLDGRIHSQLKEAEDVEVEKEGQSRKRKTFIF